VAVVLSVPFLVTGNFVAYVRALVAPGSSPVIRIRCVFSFSGLGALLSWFHDIFGWILTKFIAAMIPFTLIALVVTGILCYKRRITALQAALAGFLVFVAFITASIISI